MLHFIGRSMICISSVQCPSADSTLKCYPVVLEFSCNAQSWQCSHSCIDSYWTIYKGNVFTGVSHSVQGGVWCKGVWCRWSVYLGGVWLPGVCVYTPSMPEMASAAVSTHPTGMHFYFSKKFALVGFEPATPYYYYYTIIPI